MVLGSMGMKRIVVQVVNRFGYRRVLVAGAHGLAAVSLLFMFSALAGWYARCRWSCFCRDDQRQPLLLNEYPDAERSPGQSGQQRQRPAVDGDAAVDGIGVTIAGLLLGLYGQQHMSLDAASTHQVFLYTYLSMAAIIALPALIFPGTG